MQEYVLKIYKSATFADIPNTCFQMVYPAWSNWWLLVDPPNVYGIGGTVLYHRGGKHGLQHDGEERTVGRDETVQALGGSPSVVPPASGLVGCV